MISECCGAEDRTVYESGPDYSEIMICPECGDHCVFISEEEFGNECANSQEIDALTGDE